MADGSGGWGHEGAHDQGWWVVKCDSRTVYVGTERRCLEVARAGQVRRQSSKWTVAYRVVSLLSGVRRD